MFKPQTMIPSLASNSVSLGIILAMVGGFLDAYTFISRDGVFANAQTGNIVLLGVHLALGEWQQMILYIPPIVAFILGVFISEVSKIFKRKSWITSSRRFVLLIECIVLVIVGLLPATIHNSVVTILIAFASSLQIATFNKIDKWNYNSTVTTGNLRTASKAAYAAWIEHNEEAKKQFKSFAIVIFSFFLGGAIGTYLTVHIGNPSIWIAVIFLIVALLLYHKDRGYYIKSYR